MQAPVGSLLIVTKLFISAAVGFVTVTFLVAGRSLSDGTGSEALHAISKRHVTTPVLQALAGLFDFIFPSSYIATFASAAAQRFIAAK
jgi:hypothetical protein